MLTDIVLAVSFIATGWWLFRRSWQNGYRRGYEHGALAVKHHIFEQMGFVSAEDQD